MCVMFKRTIIACFLFSFEHETNRENEIRVIFVEATKTNFLNCSINDLNN